MSNSPTFRSTITGGIQDISALLPLLGTDQCEKHVGSALDGGFLYSAATPLSLFGSLGIVRASVGILVASLNIPRYQFMGAKLLYYSGINLSGTVAPMIALDPKHPDRFLAETKLEEMLAEQHIVNVPGLTVSWPEGAIRWNLMLVASTLLISLAGLLPYISLILDSGDARPKLFFPLGFGFPILRVFGSAICVIVAQFLIQLRIIILMKTRLLFISIDQLAKLEKIDVYLKREKADDVWTSEVAAERNIWVLRKWLPTMPNVEGGSSSSYQQIEALYTSESAQHFGAINSLLHSWIPVFLCFSLAIGCISTVVGYIGCFFLVQHSTNPKGPLLWLVLEAILSVLRIFVWAVNPSWDDSKGMEFKLQLFASPSMLIYNSITTQEILEGNLALLPEHNVHFQDIVAYAGLRPTFSVQGVAIFYLVIFNSKWNPSKRLFMVISITTEQQLNQRSRLLVKEGVNSSFTIYRCTLEAANQSTSTILDVSTHTQHDTHILTSNSVFMAELEAHYDEINFCLQNRNTTEEQSTIFKNTWAMQRPLVETTNNNQQSIEAHIELPVLTEGEKAQLDCHGIWRPLVLLHDQMDNWIANHIMICNNWICCAPGISLPSYNEVEIRNKVVSFLRQHEAIERAHLFLECRQRLEQFLICVNVKWAKDVHISCSRAVKANIKHIYEGCPLPLPGISHTRDWQRNNVYEHRLEAKLLAERDNCLKASSYARATVTSNRIGEIYRELSDQWGVDHNNGVQLYHQLDAFQRNVWDYYSNPPISNSSPDFADIFRLPSDIAANLSGTTSVLQQYCMLLQLQKTRFFGQMDKRFASYSLNLDNEAKAVINKAKDRCRTRANQLFEMLRLSDKIDLKDIIDSPGLPSPSELRDVFTNVNREYNEKVRRLEEELARMGEESKGKRIVQNVQQGAESADSESEGTGVDSESKGERVAQNFHPGAGRLARMGADSESEEMGMDSESKGMGADLESKGERTAQNVQQWAEEVARMGVESKGKRVGQTKITQYFPKQSAR